MVNVKVPFIDMSLLYCSFRNMQISSYITMFISAIFLGIFSTLIMDLSNFLAKKTGIHLGGNYALIGRWMGGFFRGRFTYAWILKEPPHRHEVLIGIIAHYCIGIALALIYLLLMSKLGLPADSFVAAIVYGLLTNILPWFVMFPAFGFGVLGRMGPPNNSLLKTSFCNHLSFGMALALGALWLRTLFNN